MKRTLWGLLISVAVTAVLSKLLGPGAFLLFLFLPFTLRLGRSAPRERTCPACGHRATDPRDEFCPRDGSRLSL